MKREETQKLLDKIQNNIFNQSKTARGYQETVIDKYKEIIIQMNEAVENECIIDKHYYYTAREFKKKIQSKFKSILEKI